MTPDRSATMRHETARHDAVPRDVTAPRQRTGWCREIQGGTALAYGMVAAAHRAGLPLFLGAHPAAPTVSILRTLAGLGSHGVRYFQAEDEIAAAGAALGASFAGVLGATITSGPGMMLKAQTIGLAAVLDLPMVVVNVQHGTASTGLPGPGGQADLMQALHGRSGEIPLPVVAAQSPADCFGAAFEACRLALAHRTPTVLLTDAFLACGREPWQVPAVDSLPDLRAVAALTGERRESATVARQQKIDSIAVPDLAVDDPGGQARLLVLGWGSTCGPISAACQAIRDRGGAIARAHLRHLNPLPANLPWVLDSYDAVLVPELNLGQLAEVIRAHCVVDTIGYTQARGGEFTVTELEKVFANVLKAVST